MRVVPYVVLWLGAFAVRLVYLLEWSDDPLFTVLLGDGAEYDRWAREIAGGNWFGDEVFYQAPLYPYFVASVYGLAGPSLWVLRLTQIALGSSACILLALAGRRFFDEQTGWLAGALAAIYAPSIFFDALVQKGVLGGLLMALLLFLLGELSVRRRWGWAFAAGLTLGAFALARENALVLPPVVLIWMVVGFGKEPAAQRAGWAAALVAGLGLVLVPVGARNAAIGGRFLVTTSQAGPNFWIGNHPGANGRYQPLREGRGNVRYERTDAERLAELATGRTLSPAEVSRHWMGRAWSWIADHPLEWLSLLSWKSYLVWHAAEIMDTDSLEAHGETSRLLRAIGSVAHFGVMLPLAVFGVWVTRAACRRLWLLYAIELTLAAAVVLFFVMARYRYPLVPVVLLFAAAGARELVRRGRAGEWPALARGAAVVLALMIPVNWPIRAAVDARSVTYYSLGQALVEQGRLDEARVPLERAIAIDRDFAEAHVRLGDVLARTGEPAGAERHLREALRLDPGSVDAHTILGTLHLGAGDLETAAALFEAALGLDPANAFAHNNLAIVRVQQERLAEAVVHWQASLDADPDDPTVLVNLAQVLAVLGRTDEARKALERALGIDPGNDEARQWLARLPGR